MTRTWTREDVEALGPTTNVKTGASIVGIGHRLAYESIQRGEWPTRVLRLGSRILIPTHDLIVLLFAPDMSETGLAGPVIADNVPSKDATDATTVRPTPSSLRTVRTGP
jgi:hypothetical protein